MASLLAGGPSSAFASAVAAPSFEEVLRLQREEEEEEEQRDREAAHVQAAIARAARARQQEEQADAAERAADDERWAEDEAAAASRVSLPPSASQPSGWLTLEPPKGGLDGSAGVGSGGAVESKKRWCVLMRAFLFYAGTNKDVQHPKGVVDLKGCEVALARAPMAHGAESGSPPPHLPCAFVISHPRRPELTFTAPSEMEREQWMRAIQAAIRTPTHALLSYKGRQIFDEEDAQAIAQSREAIRGFVSEQFQRIATQKREVSEKLQRKKADIKTLKAQKKALAQQLIGMTQQYTSATQESESLSSQLESVQMEGRCYDQAQHALLLQLVSLLNQMEECDPNRWTAGPMQSCTFSAATSPQSHRSGGTSAGRGSRPSSVHSSPHPTRARATRGQQQQLTTVEDELVDSEWAPATYAHSSLAHGSPPRHQRGAISSTLTSTSSFLTPQRALSPSSGGSFRQGHHRSVTSFGDRSSLSARSATAANLGAVIDDDESEVSDIDLSSEQLQRVQEQVEALHATPVESLLASVGMGDSHGGLGGIGSDSFSTLSSSPPTGLSSLPSFTSGDLSPSLSRADQLELAEVKGLAIDALQVGLKLRLEQNTLTAYIDSWMRRKHAIALLKME